MGVIKNTLKDSYIFFVRELARLDEKIKALHPGSISIKKTGKSASKNIEDYNLINRSRF